MEAAACLIGLMVGFVVGCIFTCFAIGFFGGDDEDFK